MTNNGGAVCVCVCVLHWLSIVHHLQNNSGETNGGGGGGHQLLLFIVLFTQCKGINGEYFTYPP